MPHGPLVYRQRLLTRITHWLWAVSLFFLLLTGLQIFNAFPSLHIGAESGFDEAAERVTPKAEGAAEREGEVDFVEQFAAGKDGVEEAPGIAELHLEGGAGAFEDAAGSVGSEREEGAGGDE